MRSLGEGLRLQTQQGTDSGEGSQKQVLLTAEWCHERQESTESWNWWETGVRNLFLAEKRSTLGGCKGFLTHSLQDIPDSWAPLLVVPAICEGKVPSGADAVLPVLSYLSRPWIQRDHSILSSGKTVILLWKWWDFPDLFSSTAVRMWRPGRGREEGGPQLLPLKVISGCSIKLSSFRWVSPHSCFSCPPCLNTGSCAFPLPFFGFF